MNPSTKFLDDDFWSDAPDVNDFSGNSSSEMVDDEPNTLDFRFNNEITASPSTQGFGFETEKTTSPNTLGSGFNSEITTSPNVNPDNDLEMKETEDSLNIEMSENGDDDEDAQDRENLSTLQIMIQKDVNGMTDVDDSKPEKTWDRRLLEMIKKYSMMARVTKLIMSNNVKKLLEKESELNEIDVMLKSYQRTGNDLDKFATKQVERALNEISRCYPIKGDYKIEDPLREIPLIHVYDEKKFWRAPLASREEFPCQMNNGVCLFEVEYKKHFKKPGYRLVKYNLSNMCIYCHMRTNGLIHHELKLKGKQIPAILNKRRYITLTSEGDLRANCMIDSKERPERFGIFGAYPDINISMFTEVYTVFRSKETNFKVKGIYFKKEYLH